jgi:potassium-dependent mechanosensitive channel
MPLFKFIFYFLILSFSLLPVNAVTTDNAEALKDESATETLSTVTPSFIEEQDKTIAKAQTTLEKARTAFESEEQALQKKIAGLEQIEKITQPMRDKAAEDRQTANQRIEQHRLTRQEIQAELDKLSVHLTTLQTTFGELTQYPREVQTVAQNQRISEVEKEVALQQNAVKLQKQYLEILQKQTEVAVKRTILTIEWHNQLQTLPKTRRIQEQEKAITETQKALAQQQETLLAEQKDLPNKIANLETSQVTVDKLKEMLEKAALDKEAASVEVTNLSLERQSSEANLNRENQHIKEQEEKLETLRKTPPVESEQIPLQEKRIAELEHALKLQQKLLELEGQNLSIITQHIEHAEKKLQLATEWYGKLQPVLQMRQKQELEAKLHQEQQRYLSTAADLRWELNKLSASEDNVAQRYLLQVQIQEANEMAQHVLRHLDLEHFQAQLQQWHEAVKKLDETKDVSPKQLENIQMRIEELNTLLLEVHTLQERLEEKTSALEKQQLVFEKRGETLKGQSLRYNNQAKQTLEKLHKKLQQQLDKLPSLLADGEELQSLLETAYKKKLQQMLLRQRQLPTNLGGWQSLFSELGTLPTLFWQQLQLTGRGFWQAFQQTTMQRWLIIGFSVLILLSFLKGLDYWFNKKFNTLFNKVFNTLPSAKGRSYLILVVVNLIQKNLWSIAITGIVLLLIWLTQPTHLSIVVTLIILLTWLGSKMLINLSWLLLSNLKTTDGTKLHRQLNWIIIVMGILTVMTALVHVEEEELLKLSLTARDVIDTIFMVFLSLMVPPFLRVRQLILDYLQKNQVQGYWRVVTGLLTLLIPLVIVAVSVFGVIGYINLGWSVAKQLSIFMLVLTGLLIMRGALDDLIKLLKELVLTRSQYGELWAEDIIPLVHKLLGFALFILAIFAIFWFNGWASDVAVKEKISQILNFAFITFENGSQIRLMDVILSIIIIWSVFWFGGWSRRVTYRWVFLNIKDAGIRNSLSVFTQYFVVFIGLIIALKAIGIDPTALSVFAGALGVGIGFGMQTIINNFLSGILLLVERPVRSGDSIEVGDVSGTVAQIGIRSTTIETLDRTEVILPNSDLISSAFTNRTRTDKIRRTVLFINISYEDDPHLVKEMISSVLDSVPDVLKDPEYGVALFEFAEYAMKFRIAYFVDTGTASLGVVKSQVLFNIWDRFKVMGIKIPYPQQDVHLNPVAKSKAQELELLSSTP